MFVATTLAPVGQSLARENAMPRTQPARLTPAAEHLGDGGEIVFNAADLDDGAEGDVQEIVPDLVILPVGIEYPLLGFEKTARVREDDVADKFEILRCGLAADSGLAALFNRAAAGMLARHLNDARVGHAVDKGIALDDHLLLRFFGPCGERSGQSEEKQGSSNS